RLGATDEIPLRLAEDESFQVRAAVATAAGSRTDPGSLETLEGLAEDPRVAVRTAAVTALAERLGERALPRLETLAVSDDWRLRSTAARAAGGLGEAGRPLVETLLTDADTRVRTAALEALGAFGDARDAIVEALTADDLAVRGTAVQMVPEAGIEDAAALLDSAYQGAAGDSWTEVREGVVDSLAKVEGGEPLLRRIASEDPAASVRARARTALDGLGAEVPAAGEPAPPPGPSPYLGVSFEHDPLVSLETDRGELRIRVLAHQAPIHAAHFVDLVDQGFYDGLIFHRVVPNFVVQGGDPRGDGWGSGDLTLRDEIHPGAFVRGSVGMPKAGKDTGGCQLFITHLPTPHLDGNYTIFGQVEEGLDVVDALEVGDHIVRARVLER
ncbi:MAG: peptidylprolyl isomerase, partial [Acidobacteria bacterium]|nr:peptidylprolyl isomerase [Acidobacteriota bacterium]